MLSLVKARQASCHAPSVCTCPQVVKQRERCNVVCAPNVLHSACASVCRLRNSPHEELLAAATEQMKITELRLRKLVATQERGEAQKASATATAERRAGLVYNHLMGALTTCKMQQKQIKRQSMV